MKTGILISRGLNPHVAFNVDFAILAPRCHTLKKNHYHDFSK